MVAHVCHIRVRLPPRIYAVAEQSHHINRGKRKQRGTGTFCRHETFKRSTMLQQAEY